MATLLTAEIKPGTTPILNAMVEGEDLHEATVYVTIDMGGDVLTKSNYHDNSDVTATAVYSGITLVGTQVTVQYSQSETLMLRPGNAEVEVGWVFADRSADKTNVGRLKIPKTLYRGVMLHG